MELHELATDEQAIRLGLRMSAIELFFRVRGFAVVGVHLVVSYIATFALGLLAHGTG